MQAKGNAGYQWLGIRVSDIVDTSPLTCSYNYRWSGKNNAPDQVLKLPWKVLKTSERSSSRGWVLLILIMAFAKDFQRVECFSERSDSRHLQCWKYVGDVLPTWDLLVEVPRSVSWKCVNRKLVCECEVYSTVYGVEKYSSWRTVINNKLERYNLKALIIYKEYAYDKEMAITMRKSSREDIHCLISYLLLFSLSRPCSKWGAPLS